MRSNGLLKWLMIPVAILVLFAGIRLFSVEAARRHPWRTTAPSSRPRK